MHPRNVFKQCPNYTHLAIKYPEFRKMCRLELNGKVYVDYKIQSTLKVLTQTLCLEYFQLKVEFAPNSLVPTLTLRLNYILWLEDLLEFLESTTSGIKGIDIGCGSSCIYCLLAARKNLWHMVALETDEVNVEYAKQNILRNNLEEFISLYYQSTNSQIFQDFFQQQGPVDTDDNIYDFCSCNPPFYDSNEYESPTSNTKNPSKRPPPRNCPTGKKEELSCEGGEVKFIETIIKESLLYKSKIKIFTSMIGHKSNLKKITSLLEEKNINNYCTTEFHQGKTTRWGIAWTFLTNLDLRKQKESPCNVNKENED